MRRSTKLHTIAIASITGLVLIVYALFAPSNAPDQPHSNRTIEIVSATWGANCNAQIATAISTHSAAPLTKNDDGSINAPKPLAPVQANNVLSAVSDACNRQPQCTLPVKSESLGVEPFTECYKRLDVTYRCFNYDSAHTLATGQGKTLLIDCNAASPLRSQ